MIGPVVFGVTLLCYALFGMSRNMTLSYRIISGVNIGLLFLLIIDIAARNLMGLDWFGTPFIYLLLYIECLLFHRLSRKGGLKRDRLPFLPLINFSYLILTYENINNANMSLFIIGALMISYLNFKRYSQREKYWNWFLPLALSSFMLLFSQFNNGLSWSIGFLFMIYFLLGKRLPLPLYDEKTAPFNYPLVARVALISILIFDPGPRGNLESFFVGYALMMVCFMGVIFNAKSDNLRWSLYNKGLEVSYLGALILFGYSLRSKEMLLLFVCLSLTSFVGLISFKKPIKGHIFLQSLVLLFLCGFFYGPTRAFIESLKPLITYYGEINVALLAFGFLVALNSLYFYTSTLKKRTFSPS